MQNTAAYASADLPDAVDEAALIRAAQRDRAAFGLLYQCHVDRVYGYLRSRTDNDEDAADLTQQVFLQAMSALPRYHHNGIPFRAWLLRIARNTAINFRSRRRATAAFDLLPEALQPSYQYDPTSQLEQIETFGQLFAALDVAARELVLLRFAAQLTVAEIAAVTGKSEAATRMRLIRILRALKEQYDDQTNSTFWCAAFSACSRSVQTRRNGVNTQRLWTVELCPTEARTTDCVVSTC